MWIAGFRRGLRVYNLIFISYNFNMGIRLKELRTARSLSQQQLGIKFNVGKTTVSHYENSERDIPTDLVRKFAKFFGVTTDYLLGESDSKTNPNDLIPSDGFDADMTMILDALREIDFSAFNTNDTKEFIDLMKENAVQISGRHKRNQFADTLQSKDSLNVAENRKKLTNN